MEEKQGLNLVNDPWFTVQHVDGRFSKTGLKGAFDDSSIMCVHDTCAATWAAIMRLLAAVNLWANPDGSRNPAAASKKLSDNAHLFELAGDKPFLQHAGLADMSHKSVTVLMKEAFSNESKVFSSFDYACTSKTIDADVAARRLLTHQVWISGGITSGPDPDENGTSAARVGTWTGAIVLLPVAETLEESIHLCTPAVERNPGTPLWEGEPTGVLGFLTQDSKSMHLSWDGSQCIGVLEHRRRAYPGVKEIVDPYAAINSKGKRIGNFPDRHWWKPLPDFLSTFYNTPNSIVSSALRRTPGKLWARLVTWDNGGNGNLRNETSHTLLLPSSTSGIQRVISQHLGNALSAINSMGYWMGDYKDKPNDNNLMKLLRMVDFSVWWSAIESEYLSMSDTIAGAESENVHAVAAEAVRVFNSAARRAVFDVMREAGSAYDPMTFGELNAEATRKANELFPYNEVSEA